MTLLIGGSISLAVALALMGCWYLWAKISKPDDRLHFRLTNDSYHEYLREGMKKGK